MKKMVLMVAVMMIAAPVMAQVNFVATDMGDGKLQIGYTNTGSPDPRGIAIEVEITSGDATFDVLNAFVSQGIEYNCNIDYLYTNGGGVGDGNPLAEPDVPGVYTGTGDDGEQKLVISLGFLDDAGGLQAAQTAATVTNLVTLQLTKDLDLSAWVTISADTTRGPASGVVGSEVASTFPAAVEIVFGDPECFDSGHPDYDAWVAAGSPACWCNMHQCQGDGAGNLGGSSKGGYFYVGVLDLNLLMAAWNVMEPPMGPGIDSVPGGICADFARNIGGSSKGGYFHVGVLDLNRLMANWNVMEVPVGLGLAVDTCGGTIDPPVPAVP